MTNVICSADHAVADATRSVFISRLPWAEAPRLLSNGRYATANRLLLTPSEPPTLALSSVDGLDGDADGVDLIVVSGVGERTHFVKKHIQPRSADEDDLAFFGTVCPRQGSREFVIGDRHQTDRVTGERRLSPKVMDDGLCVNGILDTVFGVALVS